MFFYVLKNLQRWSEHNSMQFCVLWTLPLKILQRWLFSTVEDSSKVVFLPLKILQRWPLVHLWIFVNANLQLHPAGGACGLTVYQNAFGGSLLYFSCFVIRAFWILTSYVGGSMSSGLCESVVLYIGKSGSFSFDVYYSWEFVIICYKFVIALMSVSPEAIVGPFAISASSSSDSFYG